MKPVPCFLVERFPDTTQDPQGGAVMAQHPVVTVAQQEAQCSWCTVEVRQTKPRDSLPIPTFDKHNYVNKWLRLVWEIGKQNLRLKLMQECYRPMESKITKGKSSSSPKIGSFSPASRLSTRHTSPSSKQHLTWQGQFQNLYTGGA